jgi:hypothetical protein
MTILSEGAAAPPRPRTLAGTNAGAANAKPVAAMNRRRVNVRSSEDLFIGE